MSNKINKLNFDGVEYDLLGQVLQDVGTDTDYPMSQNQITEHLDTKATVYTDVDEPQVQNQKPGDIWVKTGQFVKILFNGQWLTLQQIPFKPPRPDISLKQDGQHGWVQRDVEGTLEWCWIVESFNELKTIVQLFTGNDHLYTSVSNIGGYGVLFYKVNEKISLNKQSQTHEVRLRNIITTYAKTFPGTDTNLLSTVQRGAYFDSQTQQDDWFKYWDTSQFESFNNMFQKIHVNGNLGVRYWDTSNVEDMSYMFRLAYNYDTSKPYQFSENLQWWDMTNVEDMTGMFQYCGNGFTPNISDWDVRNVSNMSNAFQNQTYNPDVKKWDVSNVGNMDGMFNNNTTFTRNISHWCVRNIFTQPQNFGLSIEKTPKWGEGCKLCPSENQLVNNNFDCSTQEMPPRPPEIYRKQNGVTLQCLPDTPTGFYEFEGEWHFVVSTLQELKTQLSGLTNTTKVDLNIMFNGVYKNILIENLIVTKLTTLEEAFWGRLFSATNVNINKWDVSNVTNMSRMFIGVTVQWDFSLWDVSNVTNMSGMFEGGSAYKHSEPQGITNWDVSSVVNMNRMFYLCKTQQNLSSWCVKNIPSQPSGFIANAGDLAQNLLPKWGEDCITCTDGSRHHEDFMCPL